MSETGRVEPTPELGELEQETTALPAVPVTLAEAATVYALPARYVQYQTDTVPTTWTSLFPGTPKRARGLLVSHDEPIYINDASTGQGMLWPAGLPYPWQHSRPVFVKCATDDMSTKVGASVELWAD